MRRPLLCSGHLLGQLPHQLPQKLALRACSASPCLGCSTEGPCFLGLQRQLPCPQSQRSHRKLHSPCPRCRPSCVQMPCEVGCPGPQPWARMGSSYLWAA